MNQREARVYALRLIADDIDSSIGGRDLPLADDDASDKVFRAMEKICSELRARADAMVARKPVRSFDDN
jgi:hypothetical protein